ncbi:hypothetical protein [Williamsia sp. CHRR-6]|uniref:hypothetical protein n=1 Tax=Williamsia sp. CHRR-6 TaxID=2835871 RepID=UPI001BDAB649|nr:hypothetical protein [Williamsia sp. CHRR-6]MBT0568365.1 hypothetical protein [Williamsia sp. CHRR-6]
MHHWYTNDIVGAGRLPLLFFFVGFIGGFLVTRVSVRLIRAEVRWWFGNVSAGQTHIHHMVFGVVLSLVSGVSLIAVSITGSQATLSVLSCAFGIGAALVLDEFALIFYLRDVYWAEEGRASVDAVFAALGATGMVLLGFRPMELFELSAFGPDAPLVEVVVGLVFAAVGIGLAAVVLVKGKIWTGLIGIFFWPLLVVGALRMARPGSPWARWRYTNRPRRMQRALRRERRIRRPVIRAKIYLQDLMAGRPDVPHVKAAAEAMLDEVVHAAPPPPHDLPRVFGPSRAWARPADAARVEASPDPVGSATGVVDPRGDSPTAEQSIDRHRDPASRR